MDRIECRRCEESLDRKAWLQAYRAARKGKKGEGMVARARTCLVARSWADARALEHISFRPRPAGLRSPPAFDFFGFPIAA